MLALSRRAFQRAVPSVISTRTSSAKVAGRSVTTTSTNIQVEHGRGQWKTYGDVESYKPGHFQIKTYNKLSPIGLSRFPDDSYDVISAENAEQEGGKKVAANAHAILLRSHKLLEEEVPHTVRAIARYVFSSQQDRKKRKITT
jgi:D-3-phosphoglycerate dehydrogenase / 2-oxoglutarate reductase